ncbi:MotA/TolQ/ExbB proton channel family protein [Methanosphaera sp. DEW79]|jgi:biopolymer transport protein ExbB/TolQ|uniref:MotA/TolQ/ExbB proton channel family protein n=1 Tax=Methanosphaera sp. DEW79 TaxID=1945576 RepID=UPI000DC2029D|nr:MotA/TolQ/ExbB proton channel family protein [Methanosphaera sp. DEW79]RAP48461.1 MAG: flagellar motor protein MotA [Methanosphaera sp. DEW79]
MSSTLIGGEFINGSLDIISQSLSIPVLIILIIIFVISIVSLGGLISEYTSRKNTSVYKIKELIYDINNVNSIEELPNIINNYKIPKSNQKVLLEVVNSHSLTPKSREALARKLVDNQEEKIDKKLEKTDIITRIGPTLGLMGTLIPLGPGLAALGSGDINTLASSLTIAFNTTVVGIGAGAISYFIGKIRRNWYSKLISDLDVLTDTILDFIEECDRNG